MPECSLISKSYSLFPYFPCSLTFYNFNPYLLFKFFDFLIILVYYAGVRSTFSSVLSKRFYYAVLRNFHNTFIRTVHYSLRPGHANHNYHGIRLKSIMLQNFLIILSGTSFFLTYYSQNYAHNSYDSCSQFTHYV